MAFQFLDAYGRPVQTALLRQEQAAPTIQGVRRRDALHPAAGLTPGRLASILRASIESTPEDYLALAEDMEERDLHYASVMQTRKLQVAGLEVTIEAAGDDPRSIEIADFVRDALARDDFETELFDMLDAVGKGFSCTEILWDTSERQWMPSRLAWRDPRWFEFDRVDQETPLLRGVAAPEPLKPFGWIFHVSKSKSGLPIRGGLARNAAWAFLFKSFTMKDWAIFSEAYGQPLRLGKYGPGATEKDKEVLLEAVASMGSDFAAIVPVSMAIDLVEAKISGTHELYEKRADWLDRQVSKLVLGQTSTTDAQKGSYAVGKVHDGVRDDIEKADAKALASTLKRDLVKPMVDLNFGPQQRYPLLKIGRPDEVDVEKFMGNVEKFVKLGGRVGAAEVRDRIGVSDPAPDEELLGAPKAEPDPAGLDDPAAPPAPGAVPGQPAAMAARRPAKRTDAIDDAAALAARDWEPLIGPLVAGLDTSIAAATSIDEVRAILRTRLEGLSSEALGEELARAVFAARLAGEADETLS